MSDSPGLSLKKALNEEKPLQVVGTANAYAAMMAQQVGFKAIYLSGAGVANISYGLPDLGITTLDNVLEDTKRITFAVKLPLIVDIDTGWGNRLMIARVIKEMIRAYAAGVQIEDQVMEKKRCGHLPGKKVVPIAEMQERIKAAVDARTDPDFVIIARTDSYALEGFESMLKRLSAYEDAGADILFPEALTSIEEYRTVKRSCKKPILANLTEFGMTPLFTLDELAGVSVDMALYPLSATRAMNLAALNMFREIRKKGTQKQALHLMQSRDELYKFLNY